VVSVIPVAIAAHPTVDDVLRERIERDTQIAPENKAAVFLRARQLIREQGLAQL
jgi:hypothetical protein